MSSTQQEMIFNERDEQLISSGFLRKGKPSELEKDSVDSYGTINCFIILDCGILVGVDSRGTDQSSDFSEAWKDVWIWRDDTNIKYRKIHCADNRSAVITFAGNRGRIIRMLAEVGKNMADDFDQLVTLVRKFFTDIPLKNEDKKKACQLYLAGFSVSNKAFTVYHVGDLLDNYKMYTSKSHSHFGAIGSGGDCGLEVLNNFNISPDMHYKEALSCITNCLIEASVLDPRCGGSLRVLRLTEEGKRVSDLLADHCIDSILQEKYPFPPNSLFLFSSESIDNVNYDVLHRCFRSTCKLSNLSWNGI